MQYCQNNDFFLFEQYAEKDYFLDGLLSCGTHACLEVFAHCLKNGQVYDPIISSLFSYDLAINHEPSPEILSVLFVSVLCTYHKVQLQNNEGVSKCC